jgi:hypothetical protein
VTERGGVLATALVVLLLVFWLGLLVHVDRRFPGSVVGVALASVGSLLMLIPLVHMGVKRLLGVRGNALRTWLTLHIYAGLVGPILVLLHTGHKFNNPLGVLLTLMTLIVVLSGFVGRSLLQQTSKHLREKRDDLARFQPAFDALQDVITRQVEQVGLWPTRRYLFVSVVCPWAIRSPQLREIGRQGTSITGAMAVLEVSIALHERMQRWFKWWMRVHLTLTTVLYLLLAMHIFVVSYYGWRWFPV